MILSRNITVFGIISAALISLGLFQVKYIVLDLERTIQGIHRDIFTLQDSIHILEAEYAHLRAPDRLEGLAKKHLDLGPIKPWQFVSLEDIPLRPKAPENKPEQTIDNLLQILVDEPLDQKEKTSQNYGKEKK